MANSKAARRYAKALFLQAAEENRLDAVQADLLSTATLLEASADLRRFLGNYLVPPARRVQALGEIFERQGGAEPLLTRFLFLLEEKRRLALLPEIIGAFGEFFDQERGILRVKVTSARPMEAGQVDRIVARLKQTFGKDIRPAVSVDPRLLGGFIVQVGDLIRDLSVESQLERLQRRLAQG